MEAEDRPLTSAVDGVEEEALVPPADAPNKETEVDEAVYMLNKDGRAGAARDAFAKQDAELSQSVHDMGGAPEEHQDGGEYVKAVVFGGLDGIICAFSSVAAVVGAQYSSAVIFVVGFAGLFANAISMGVGELLSEKAERSWIMKERSREVWEFDHAPEAEVKEMVELYVAKGFSEEEATRVLQIMSKYKEFFIDHMLVQELGIMPPEGDDSSPLKQGMVMFFSFIAFGLVPLMTYVVLSPVHWTGFDARFLICCILTGVALFILGALKSKFSHQSWWWSGIVVAVNGGFAAAAGFGISYGLQAAIGSTCG